MNNPLTDQELHQAWIIRRRPDWPATYEQVMRDEVLSRIVHMQARHTIVTTNLITPERRASWGRINLNTPVLSQKDKASGERDLPDDE